MDEHSKPRATGRQAPTAGPRGDEGNAALSYVLAGMIFYGGLGWLGSRYLHQAWMLPVGLVLGVVASMYLIIKRYGKSDVTMNPRGVDQ
ncbi:AtpZ/AtpI family protein [Luteococcus sp. Sow4_B9]|uniref:AtpZ/AtpI family protein n=1 Tax=Luteococcus sp. Sow4_B9 TaxID=3438792 RepID=UPI003F951C0B